METQELFGLSDEKYLGKQLEWERIIFIILRSLIHAEFINDRGAFVRAVRRLEAEFPYKDAKYKSDVIKLDAAFAPALSRKDKLGNVDVHSRLEAEYEYSVKKKELISQLMKRKKFYPQEAEEEIY